MTNSINVFVPIYNEIGSVEKIEDNIRRTIKVFPDVHFFFYDNASEDGTANFLSMLKERFPDNITVSINTENIGFQRNLAKIAELPSDRMILILGANDLLYTPGLRQLRAILNKGEFDLVICNTCYVVGTKRLRMLANEEDKVRNPFVAKSIDEYFLMHGTIPNGIMQYVVHPRHCRLFGDYASWMSPQVAVFFDIFPGRVCYLPPPPISLVNRTEGSGWRSAVEGVIETHMVLARDIVGRAWQLYSERRMSLWTYVTIRFSYTHAVMFLIYRSLVVRGYWGDWQSPWYRRPAFLARIWKDLFTLRPQVAVNPLFITAVSGAFVFYQVEALAKCVKKVFHE